MIMPAAPAVLSIVWSDSYPFVALPAGRIWVYVNHLEVIV